MTTKDPQQITCGSFVVHAAVLAAVTASADDLDEQDPGAVDRAGDAEQAGGQEPALADRTITDVAGLCVICIAFFPTAPGYRQTAQQVLIGHFYLTFACIAFVLLSVMAFRFAKREPAPPGLTWWQQVKYAFGFTGQGDSQAPRWERVVYRVSGVVILICIILIDPPSAVATYSLLVLETIMQVSFGLSWFVKGRKILFSW
jgi:hypothetical protein